MQVPSSKSIRDNALLLENNYSQEGYLKLQAMPKGEDFLDEDK